jgi:hypothetical protein
MNGNEPAFPSGPEDKPALTKREYAAIQIATGLAQGMFTESGMRVIQTFMDMGNVKDAGDCITNMAVNLSGQLMEKLAKGESK